MAVRRAAAPPPPPAPVASGPSFLSLGFYSGSSVLPEGKWALEFNLKHHQAVNAQTGAPYGKPRLGCMITAYPLLADGKGGYGFSDAEPSDFFFSMGGKADQSFSVDPNDSKRLTAVPGAPANGMSGMSNWFVFLKSLFDTGLPDNLANDSVEPLDGIWVQIAHIPEPSERKDIGKAKTGENADLQEERKGPGICAVVSEILEGGKPWEGGGGLPDAAPAPAAPAARPGPTRVAAPQAAPAAAAGDAGELEIAQEEATKVLEKNPDGLSRLKLRTAMFKSINDNPALGPDNAQSIINTYFASDDTLNAVLGPLGYESVGGQVRQIPPK